VKTVYLFRHAKSDWADPGLKDHERPLNERGKKAAPQMAAYIKSKKYKPDLILCSSARRTVETFDALKEVLGDDLNVRFEDGVYLAEPHKLIERLTWLDDGIKSVMIIGHNPGLQQLALQLTHSPEDAEEEKRHKRMREKFSTGALAVIKVPIKAWTDLKDGRGRLADFMRPKDL
jgi:phosphohistidine phosphatase